MEYLQYRGEFTDAPINQIIETFQREYEQNLSWNSADFYNDVSLETAASPGTRNAV